MATKYGNGYDDRHITFTLMYHMTPTMPGKVLISTDCKNVSIFLIYLWYGGRCIVVIYYTFSSS